MKLVEIAIAAADKINFAMYEQSRCRLINIETCAGLVHVKLGDEMLYDSEMDGVYDDSDNALFPDSDAMVKFLITRMDEFASEIAESVAMAKKELQNAV